MAFAPIAYTIPQYEDFANYWMKAFDQGTTTPKVMATDATGGTTVAKFELNALGFPNTAGDALVIPYIDGSYDLWLFPTEAEADANNTTNAIQLADNIDLAQFTDASNITFTQDGAGAIESTVGIKLREIVSVKDFGASSASSAADNLIAFNTAITALTVGGKLIVPIDSSFYSIDISGGRSAAVLVNKRIHLQIEGSIKATAGAAIEVNPATIFNVSADNVTFSGGGSIIGDGTINAENAGTAETIPSLVYVSGDNFSMTEIEIDTPFKSGVHLDSCLNANIYSNRFTGGPTEYTDTAYFAVRSDGGGSHIVSDNQFYPDATGGMYVNCLFMVSNNCLVEGNIVTHPYEKLAYITGNNNVVNDNIIIGNSGLIPGTNQQGTVGVAIRCDGANNKVTNNVTDFGGGAACRIGGGNDISGNTFINAGASAIAVFAQTGVSDHTTIRNNTITAGNLTGVLVSNGILVTIAASD